VATQKKIQAWLPNAIQIFQKFMPPTNVPFPSIHIVSNKTVFATRAKLVEQIRCHQKECDKEHYDSVMEMLHGDLGDAILIQQKYLPDPKKYPMAEDKFRHFLWHELGHFYAIRHECQGSDLHRFNNQELFDEQAKQEGYWFWSEFIAEAIACYVEEQHCSIDNSAFYHPEQIVWLPEVWGNISEKLLDFLEMTFAWYDATIDEASLAMYFAHLLRDDATKRYVKAAEDGILHVYDDKRKTRLMEPGSIDATCITDQAEAYQEPLYAMKNMLEKQMQKERFWEINEEWLENIGQYIVDMINAKIFMTAYNTD